MSERICFANAFKDVTGNRPFPWQQDLYDKLVEGDFQALTSCSLPTGLGKTAIIPIWLIALAHNPPKIPRRLVYIVNRRTVVDRATEEAERIRENLRKPALAELAGRLRDLRTVAAEKPDDPPLAISTLRGPFADNGEWCADPARPTVIIGTVDMIGSRLLFSGYGCGLGKRPMHAGFLGQDSLVVHDEAHLEPAFQELLVAIEAEQSTGRTRDFRPLRVLAFTASPRGRGKPFGLTEAEMNLPDVLPDPPTKPVHHVWRRLRAKKTIHLHENADPKKLADQIADLALRLKDDKTTVLVFLRGIEDVERVVARLRKSAQAVQQLNGTLRGLERDRLVREDPIFHCFLPKSERGDRTVYLVCTSAGEVGVDITADHLVCDLSTFESMAQRFGRVNRFGERDAEIHVVYPKRFNGKDETDQRRKRTLDLVRALDRDGSPKALDRLDGAARLAAFAPTPRILPTSDILFDAWTLTTIREKLPGRPPVEPYLRGMAAWEPPETLVAWREEVEVIAGGLLETYQPEDLLDAYFLKPHELLRDSTDRVFQHLQKLAERHGDKPVWIVANEDSVRVATLGQITQRDRKSDLNGACVLLPPSVGGLRAGLLDGAAECADDVSEEWYTDERPSQKRRVRVWDDDPEFEAKTENMRLARPPIDIRSDAEEDEGEYTAGRRYWCWYELPQAADSEDTENAEQPVLWEIHTNDVVRHIERFAKKLPLEDEVRKAMILAARFHDLGKMRADFQHILGNRAYDAAAPATAWAKAGSEKGRLGVCDDYRHEFGSLLGVESDVEFEQLAADTKDLVRHLIAAHHGRARPHFSADEAFDRELPWDRSKEAQEVPRRFARLQRKYGRWGLAFLESLLRAADGVARANPSAFVDNR